MYDVYVVHFEFRFADVFYLVCCVACFAFVNLPITAIVTALYFKRKTSLRNDTEPVSAAATCLLFFTWPLYLLLVLIKCLVGACAYVWRKV